MLRVATLNVNSLVRRERKAWLLRVLHEEKIDVVCVQETKISTREEEIELVEAFKEGFFVFHSSGVNRSAGTAVLVRKSSKVVVVDSNLEQTGRLASVDLIWNGEILRVVSLYAPNEACERNEFFKTSLSDFASTDAKLLLAGDFNCVERRSDCTYKQEKKDSSVPALKQLFEANDLVDIAVGKCPTIKYTHWQGTSHARLDRIYISGELCPSTAVYQVKPVAFTDHGLVLGDIKTKQKSQRNPRVLPWKLNESILRDEEFVSEIRNMIEGLRERGVDAPAWDLFKAEVRLKAIDHSLKKAMQKKKEVEALLQSLVTIVKEEEKFPGTFTDDVRNVKGLLCERLRERYHGAMVRSRVQAVERDETPTKVFLARERSKIGKNSISRIQDDGIIYEETQAIAGTFYRYYANLFRRNEDVKHDDNDMFRHVSKVSAEDQDKGKGQLTQREILRVIKKLPKNKAPGPDGLGSAFYVTFQEELCPILEDVFEDIRKRGLMTPTMRSCHTVLIPKKANHTEAPRVSDFRPISLLCTDYKILAKVIAQRLDNVLWKFVGSHQTYGFKGRKISNNLHLMRTACEYAKTTGMPLAVFQLDLSQAFDRVSHEFLYRLLQWVDIGKDLLQWVQICYESISSRLIVNGALGKRFPVTRSVRQGCPMSPTLFSLYLEPLCRAIVASETIKGMTLAHEEVKLLAFADDVALICRNVEQVTEAFALVQRFCASSGAQVNVKKSKGTWLGDWDDKPATFLQIPCSCEVGTYLGVCLDWEVTNEDKWKPKLNSIQGKHQPYNGRALSLLHRSFVCNCVLYPAILYSAQATSINACSIQRFERICAVFLWQSKFERMRRTNTFWPLEAGGLNVVNLAIKIHVQRFLYFRDEARPEIRAAFQVLGTGHLARWIVSTSDTGNQQLSGLGFYKEIRTSLSFFEARYSWEYLSTVKRKALYWDTVRSVFPPPLYRQGFEDRAGGDVLKRIRKLPVPTSTKDFFVRFHIEVLPVASWLKIKGFLVPREARCDICGQEETLRHALFDCSSAVLFWSDLRATLDIQREFSYEELKFLCFRDAAYPELLNTIAVAGLHALWRSRSARVNCDDKVESPVAHLKSNLLWTLSLIGKEKLADEERWAYLAPVISRMHTTSFGLSPYIPGSGVSFAGFGTGSQDK